VERKEVTMEGTKTPTRWVPPLVGGVVGLVVGAIVSVNVMIFGGAPDGYQTSIADLFSHSPVLGVVVVAIFLAGPVVGVVLGLRVGQGSSS